MPVFFPKRRLVHFQKITDKKEVEPTGNVINNKDMNKNISNNKSNADSIIPHVVSNKRKFSSFWKMSSSDTSDDAYCYQDMDKCKVNNNIFIDDHDENDDICGERMNKRQRTIIPAPFRGASSTGGRTTTWTALGKY
jgi:hypothetical protein